MKKNTDSIHHARNIFGINSIARKTSNSKLYYLYNGHADVVAMVDSNGNVINYYDYDIYGNIKEASESGIENPIRYAGQYYDDESDLYYLRARYYDPGLMRFISEDTNRGDLGDPLSLNLYTYCQGNPVRYYDPSGNVPVETVLDIVSIGTSVADLIRNPSWVNAAFLLWDVGAAVIPYAPGSYVAKGVKVLSKADDVKKVLTWVDKARDAIKVGQKLSNPMKSALRQKAVSLMTRYSDNFANVVKNGLKLDVHHIIPLEWAHLIGGNFDPNDLSNLAGVSKDLHKKLNKEWSFFRNTYKNPTKDQIINFTNYLTKTYGDQFIK